MNDKPKIILGLLIFFGVFTFPFWYNHLSASAPPKVELTEKAKAAKVCVAETEFMRREHMQILDQWRDTVVREGKTLYVAENGKEYVASLSNTCMDCHSNKAEFCDKCHTYTSADPYCWDCHRYPEEKK
jgi:hypothetical protein